MEVRNSNEELKNKIKAITNDIAQQKSETLMDSLMEGLGSFSDDDENANVSAEP